MQPPPVEVSPTDIVLEERAGGGWTTNRGATKQSWRSGRHRLDGKFCSLFMDVYGGLWMFMVENWVDFSVLYGCL